VRDVSGLLVLDLEGSQRSLHRAMGVVADMGQRRDVLQRGERMDLPDVLVQGTSRMDWRGCLGWRMSRKERVLPLELTRDFHCRCGHLLLRDDGG
jgi:hypothetical protein